MRGNLKLRRGLIWFFLGALLGMSVVQGLTSREQARLSAQSLHWRSKAEHWQQEWTQLHDEVARANQQAAKQLVVQSITVSVVRSPVAAEAVRNALDPLTSVLLGMPLAGAKASVLYEMFDGRVILIDGKLYRIMVTVLLLSAQTQLVVKAIAITPDRGSHVP